MTKKTTCIIGLTGGVGSGKSTVLHLLKARGIATADADEIVRRALEPGGDGFGPVRRLFGPSIQTPDGRLDKGAIARRVFRDPALRRRLERILHPIVRKTFVDRIARHRRGLLVLDVPLLFETGMDRLVDRTVVVWAPRSARLARLAERGMPPAEARRRMAAQMPLREKARLADDVLDNGGTRAALRRALDAWLRGAFRACAHEV